MSHKPKACSCGTPCMHCDWGELNAAAIAVHNLRCACHGERSYPGDAPVNPPKRELK